MFEPWVLVYATLLCFFISFIAYKTHKRQLQNSISATVINVQDVYETKNGKAVAIRYLLTVKYTKSKKEIQFKYPIRWPIGTVINITQKNDDIIVLSDPPRSSPIHKEPHVYDAFYIIGNVCLLATLFMLSQYIPVFEWIVCFLLLLIISCLCKHAMIQNKHEINLSNDASAKTKICGTVNYLTRKKPFKHFDMWIKHFACVKYEYNGVIYTLHLPIKEKQYLPGDKVYVICDSISGEISKSRNGYLYIKQSFFIICFVISIIAAAVLIICNMPLIVF